MADPRKRPRLSEEADEKPFVNHPTLYFDDGNIILRAGWTLFCVHKSLLSKHSSVFRDLFQRMHIDRFRELTLITMEETREDLETLLNVIYDGLRVDVQELTVETFPALATVLRMATKYNIERPCEDIVARIRAQWPATLSQHDAREAQHRAELAAARVPHPSMNEKVAGPSNLDRMQPVPPAGPAAGPSRAPAPVTVKEDLIVHPASVIGLLRECGYSDSALLFPLFYALSRTTWQFGGGALGHHLAPLSVADMERFVVGIERLRAHHAALAVSVPTFDLLPTTPPHFCLVGTQQLWSSVVFTLLVTNGRQLAREPLEEWQQVIATVSAQYVRYQICADCCRAIIAKIGSYWATTWASLPRFFELH